MIIKTGSIKTLHGIEGLTNLESVMLGNCRKLTSIVALNSKDKLRSLEIESCRRIQDYEALTHLPCLESLRLTNCNGINSIGFIENFPLLKKIALIGDTKVRDGDMRAPDRINDHFYAP